MENAVNHVGDLSFVVGCSLCVMHCALCIMDHDPSYIFMSLEWILMKLHRFSKFCIMTIINRVVMPIVC